jgi:hypothetical protein
MKIASVIGICAIAGATALGCSGSNSSGGGFTGEDISDDGGGNPASSSGVTSSSGASSNGGAGGTSGGSSGGTASSSGATASSGGQPSDAGGVKITTGDAAVGADPETDYTQTKTVTMDSFNVPANSEVFYCQTFANPWGKSVDIKTYDLSMDTGSHHMFAFYQSNATNGAVAPCAAGGLTYGPFTFTSQAPKVAQTYPATVGATLPAATGFNMMAHYLNSGTTPLTAHVSLTMYVAKSGLVTNHVGVIFDNNATMTVPATGKPYVSTSSLALNQDVNIITASSHMHKFGTNFIATATPPGGAAQTLYQTTEWDEPKPTNFTTPLHLVSGTTITWSCTDVNTTGQTLTFGEYAQTNVMCISVNIFYPVQDVNNPVLGSAIGGL